jgi:hypothetical protein
MNRARQLVAFEPLPESVLELFAGLHLAPTGTTSIRATPLSGTDLDSLSPARSSASSSALLSMQSSPK